LALPMQSLSIAFGFYGSLIRQR